MSVRNQNYLEVRARPRKSPWETILEERRTKQLESRNQELAEQVGIDALTGLRNRRKLEEDLLINWARFVRYGHPFGILLLDLNSFKAVNDTHGHATGDKVLRLVAETLKETVRKDEKAYRYGGDEVVIVTGDGEYRGLIASENGDWKDGNGPLLYRINYLVNKMLSISTDENLKPEKWEVGERMIGDVPFRIAGGIAFSDERGVGNDQELVRLADQRMYEHKRTFGLED